GIEINIDITRWLPKKENENLKEVKEKYIVEIPRYVEATPGELWVMRNADGSISAIASNYQPNHPQWPGPVKGWPLPSKDYQRERWDLYITLAESDVKLTEHLINELKNNPNQRAKFSWDTIFKIRPKDLEKFTGPEDDKFREKIKIDYEENLIYSKNKLKELKESRP
ncbi:hypothetical protein, partial [Janthinobacterium agaricidamnosum]